jgi:hypothetical protein
MYLKNFYKFETLVPFEVLSLRLDAAIPAPLTMLETLSKIFNGNAVKGRQRIAQIYRKNELKTTALLLLSLTYVAVTGRRNGSHFHVTI